MAEANVSFLRRTEYISNLASSNKDLNGGSAFIKKGPRPRKAPEASADSPAVIKRKIDKSFELAEQYLRDPKKLKHPTKKHVTLVDARPLLPDAEAMPDSGAYVSVKFLANPVQSGSNYDTRLLKGIFRPTDKPRDEEEAYEEALRAHEQDPANYPKPQNLMNYEYYLADSRRTAENFKRKLDPENPDRDSEELYTSDYKNDGKTQACFHFNKLRAYETADEVELDAATKYDLEVLLSHNDDEQFPRQKAVYYYPVIQKIQVRPQRTRNINRKAGGFAEDNENVIHQLDVTINDPSESSLARMGHYSKYPLQDPEFEEEAEQDEVLEEADEDEDAQPQRRRSPSEDREAAGDSGGDEDDE